jgi:DNA replication protein DnaC
MHEATSIGDIASKIVASIPIRDEATIERVQAERAANDAKWRAAKRDGLRDDAWRDFARRVGPRYESCRFENFTATTAPQKAIVAALKGYAGKATENKADGRGVVVFGPKGSGKDHLLSALAREFIARYVFVTWRNGADLFGDLRDAIDSHGSEREFVGAIVSADVLYLSDPLPPSGKLTEFQSSMLFRILDGRYRFKRPTWASVNAVDKNDLEDRLGAQNADRLRDGALTLFCGWPSHRKPVGAE